MIHDVTITLPTWKRIEFLIETISSLKIAYECCIFSEFKKNITLIISCEPFQYIIDYVNKIDWINKIILVNTELLGVRKNPYKVLNYAFENGSKFNLHIEDDLIFSKHILNLFFYFYSVHNDKFFIYGFYCNTKNTNYENMYKLNIVKHFSGLGWACTCKSWESIKKVWFTNPYPKYNGWDFAVLHLCNTAKTSVVVNYPFTKHIGHYGTHVTSDINYKNFGHINLYNDDEFNIYKFYF